MSTCQAEVQAGSDAAQHVMWLRNVLAELGFPQKLPTSLRLDNQGAIAFGNKTGSPSRLRHIDLRECFLRELVVTGDIDLSYVQSQDNVADILTKSLGTVAFQRLRSALGVASHASWVHERNRLV